MHKLALLALSSCTVAGFLAATPASAAEPVPCEKMLKDVKAAMKTAKLSDADKAKATDLQSQGVERCKADDDAGADALFAQALKVMGK